MIGQEGAFGELALISTNPLNQLRAATIKCEEDCKFLTLGREAYRKILARVEVEKQNRKLDFLTSY